MAKSMNADLGLAGSKEPEEEEKKDIDENISPYDLPFLSKLIVTGTIAVVCTPKKFLLKSKAAKMKQQDEYINRYNKLMNGEREESLGEFSQSRDASKSMKKSS